ncbi:MAG: hypothetical protein M3463_19380 [Verrucomicrobiota bacterium]|nr:hypothetical protein [Verrucomicrobiota bacterium]
MTTNKYSDGPDSNAAAEYQVQLTDATGVAKAVTVSKRTVCNWVKERRIPSILLSPRCRRFDLRAVMRALGRFEQKEVK